MTDQAGINDWAIVSAAGYSVFAIPAGRKKPAKPWKEYQTQRAGDDQIAEWASTKSNMGICTGALSGLVVLDLDSDDAALWATKQGLPATVEARTPRGRHIYFSHPGPPVANVIGKPDQPLPEGVDIRADGGFVVGPGSYFVPTPDELLDGKCEGRYRWADGCGPHEIELAPMPDWLLDRLETIQAGAMPQPVMSSRFVPREIPDSYVAAAVAAEIETLTGTYHGGRNDQLNRSAFALGTLVGADALDRLEAENLLMDAARQIGLSTSEARSTINSGLGDGIRNPRTLPARATPAPVAATLGIGPQANVSAPRFTSFRASDVATIEVPEQEWVVDQWIPRGAVTVLFGDGGVGKTLVSQTIGSLIAAGKPMLGFETTKLKVGAIYCEDDESELNRRQRRINDRLFDSPNEVSQFVISSRIGEDNVIGTMGKGRWEKTELFGQLHDWIRNEGIQVLILDNIMQVYGGDINDNQAATWFLNSLTWLAREMDGAVILLGHIAKAENSKFSGSMAWNNGVRCRLFLEVSQSEKAEFKALEMRRLTRAKSNYAPAGESMEWAMWNGVLVDPLDLSPAQIGAADAKVQASCDVIRSILKRDGSVSDKHQAGESYVLSETNRRAFLRRGITHDDVVMRALSVMLDNGEVVREERYWTEGSKRKTERIVPAETKVPNSRGVPAQDPAQESTELLKF